MSSERKKGPLAGLMGQLEKVREERVEQPAPDAVAQRPVKTPSHFDARLQAANKANREVKPGKQVEMVPRRWVDPATCRMWEKHNRRYDLLDEGRCRELISDINANGQQFPAIVRELHGDPDHLYEVICGARRHWTASFLNKELYIEVRQMPDRDAFVLADSENRSREDISDYERALDYAQALKDYYSTQAQMAAAMEVKPVWLSEFLALAQMPQEIVDAYPSVIEIKATHAAKLRPLLDDKKKNKAVLACAVELKGTAKSGVAVYKALLAAGRTSERRRGGVFIDQPYAGSNGKVAFRFKQTPRGGTQLVFEKQTTLPRDELEALVLKALREHLA